MIALSWSGGKDSALALARLRDERAPAELLLTTVDEESGRATHHGIPGELLRAQADAAGLPLVEVPVPSQGSPEAYAERMREAFAAPPLRDVGAVAFGDLFLEELRDFREQRLAAIGVEARFPLWGSDTTALARRLVDDGYEAVIVSVDPAAAPLDWLGRTLDAAFLDELPPSIDPCGERGEFHTFVSTCPGFSAPVGFRPGERMERDGFPFLELLPG